MGLQILGNKSFSSVITVFPTKKNLKSLYSNTIALSSVTMETDLLYLSFSQVPKQAEMLPLKEKA